MTATRQIPPISRRFRWPLVLLLIIGGTLQLCGQAWFAGIGDLPGGITKSTATGISGDGRVVIGSSSGEKAVFPIRWSHLESLTPIGTIDSGCAGTAYGINRDGSVIVGAYQKRTDTAGYIGLTSFVSSGGGFSDLFTQPESGWIENSARGVSADGSVIVGKVQLPDTKPLPCTFSGGGATVLTLPTNFNTGATAGVSGDGSVIVGVVYAEGTGLPYPTQAVAWTGAQPTMLEMIEAGRSVGMGGISSDGTFVVGSAPGTSSNVATLWGIAGGSISRLPKETRLGLGVSRKGRVVVGETPVLYTPVFGTAAFIYDRTHGVRLVSDVLEKELGVSLNGWRLLNAVGVSEDGSVIAGNGVNPQGDEEAWCAYIPYILLERAPYEGEVCEAGTVDTLRWASGGPTAINLYFSTDSGKTRTLFQSNLPASEGEVAWSVPYHFSQDCLFIFEDASDPRVKTQSGIFSIRGSHLVRQIPYSDRYEAFDPARHAWSFPNDSIPLWPEPWWNQFRYTPWLDPVIRLPYPARDPFLSARSEDFPDWPLFVRAFSEENCYYFVAAGNTGIYRGAAEDFWGSTKTKWGGSCLGMAVISLQAFGDPPLLKRSVPTMPGFNAPDDQYILAAFGCTDSIRLSINRIHIGQFSAQHRAFVQAQEAGSTVAKTVRNIRNMFLANARGGDARLRLFDASSGGGHAVAPYRLASDPGGAPNKMWIYIYDPNRPLENNAYIVADTALDSWSYDDLKWKGNGKGLMLMDPVPSFYRPNTIKKVGMQLTVEQTFLAAASTYDIYSPTDGPILISDPQGRVMGWDGDSLRQDIPAGVPISSEGPTSRPPGYTVPVGSYRINLENLKDSIVNVHVFGDTVIYGYVRHGADATQHEALGIGRTGLIVSNPDLAPKRFTLDGVFPIPAYYGEYRWLIKNLTLQQGDSLLMGMADADRIILANFGAHAATYDIWLRSYRYGSYGSFYDQKYEHGSITLNPHSTHSIDPSWFNMYHQNLQIDVDNGNDGTYEQTLSFGDQTVSVEEPESHRLPDRYELFQNYPNPFNPSTMLRYALPEQSRVRLEVFNALGESVALLVDAEQEAGTHEVRFDASRLASGVYFCRLSAGSFVKTNKILFVR